MGLSQSSIKGPGHRSEAERGGDDAADEFEVPIKEGPQEGRDGHDEEAKKELVRSKKLRQMKHHDESGGGGGGSQDVTSYGGHDADEGVEEAKTAAEEGSTSCSSIVTMPPPPLPSLLQLGADGDPPFVLAAPQLVSRTADEMTISWTVRRDPWLRDVRDVTCYKVEIRSLCLDWAAPADSSVIVAPTELSCPARTVRRRFVRAEAFMAPGSPVSIRVRAVRGPRAGLVSPAIHTRFMDGPLRLLRPVLSGVEDDEGGGGGTAGVQQEGEGGLGPVSVLEVHSGATLLDLRRAMQVRHARDPQPTQPASQSDRLP